MAEPGPAIPVAPRACAERRGRLGPSDPLGRMGVPSASVLSPSSPRPTAAPLTCDGAGSFFAQGAPCEDSNPAFCVDSDGEPLRIFRHGVHVIGASLDGRVRWRVDHRSIHRTTRRGTPGVAVLLGKSLAWFKNEPGATSS